MGDVVFFPLPFYVRGLCINEFFTRSSRESFPLGLSSSTWH
jgi:hypothetical protein